jgi:endonuclease G
LIFHKTPVYLNKICEKSAIKPPITMNTGSGYKSTFIGRHLKVALPQPDISTKSDFAPVKGNKKRILRYLHYSAVMSRKRKFSLFTAVNIDSPTFRNIRREDLFPGGTDRWVVDERAETFQWGEHLYAAPGSHFDKGHLVKREYPQWGDPQTAADAARATFFYSNCVPQVAELNRREWRSLEDYILKKESAPNRLRVSVFIGPVLSDTDPVFVRPVRGEEVQIPVFFWKVVYFTADDKTLNRVSFLMGQHNLLFRRKLVREKPSDLEAVVLTRTFFDDFEDAATYQVNTALVEQLTGLCFSPAHDPYRDERPVKIVLREVDVGGLEIYTGKGSPDFVLEGLVLR